MKAIQDRPQRHSITVEEYTRMGEARIFDSQAQIELMEEEIVEMAPNGQCTCGSREHFGGSISRVGERALVSAQNPLVIGVHSGADIAGMFTLRETMWFP